MYFQQSFTIKGSGDPPIQILGPYFNVAVDGQRESIPRFPPSDTSDNFQVHLLPSGQSHYPETSMQYPLVSTRAPQTTSRSIFFQVANPAIQDPAFTKSSDLSQILDLEFLEFKELQMRDFNNILQFSVLFMLIESFPKYISVESLYHMIFYLNSNALTLIRYPLMVSYNLSKLLISC